MSSSKSNQPLFENAVKDYLESCTSVRLSQNIKIGVPEFEIRFGQKRLITKIDYDNVVKELYLNKWNTEKIEGTQLLRISPESIDKHKIRLEIEGTDMIEIYCKTNSFEITKIESIYEYVNNLSEQLQINMVESNSYTIKYISNPIYQYSIIGISFFLLILFPLFLLGIFNNSFFIIDILCSSGSMTISFRHLCPALCKVFGNDKSYEPPSITRSKSWL